MALPITWKKYMIFIPRNNLKIWTSYANQVWNLVNPPEGIKLNGSKWVFKRNTNMKDNIQICNTSFKE
jgi:hypothetical protein